MALIKCPECGKEVSDKAAQCIHCGYPLPVAPAEEIRPEKYVPVGGEKKQGRRMLLMLLVFLALAVVGVAALTMTSPRSGLPYGVKPGMSIGEIKRQMEDHGFDYQRETQYSGYRVLYFDSCYVRGHQADFVSVTIENNGKISIGVFFEDAREHGRKNPSARYDALREELLEEHGRPTTDFSGVTAWEKGHYRVSLSYTDNTGGELWLNHIYNP